MSAMDRPYGTRGQDEFGRERYGDYGESRHGQYRGDDRPWEEDRYGDDRNRFDKHSWHNKEQTDRPPDDFQDPETLDQGIVIRGHVTRIEPYGAFIDFSTGRDQHRGLAHISQLADQRVERVEEVVQVYQMVFATVLEIQQSDPRSRPRIRLSLKGVDQTTGKMFEANSHATHDPGKARRAADRLRMFRDQARDCTWRQKGRSSDYDTLLWSRSPSPPPVKAPTKPETSSDSGSLSSSESSSSSSSSEESRHRRRRSRRRSSSRSKDRRSSRKRRNRRRYSPSISESSSSESDSDSSSSSTSKSRDEKRLRKESVDVTSVSALPGPALAMDDDDLRDARDFKGAIQGHQDEDSDDEEEGPMPLAQSSAAAAGGAARNQYGGALLPGEGQAIAQYVQQNLRIPRRGEIGYTADAIDKYEESGFVMSGSRHARMNAVRIRKENQVYSAEEQRALALITMEEKQQKEAQLLQDFRTMLKEKQKLRERPKEDAADADS